MKIYYLFSTILLMVLISLAVKAQEPVDNTFDPHGTPILKVFTNLHTGLTDSANDAGFEIRRAYLGYQYEFTPNWEMAVKLDIGGPNDASGITLNRRFAYFKNANIRYKYKNLSTQFGVIDTYQFKLQEEYWAHRYIWESYLDEYNYGPSADLGWNVSYKFTDFFSADFGVYNGEGYSKIQGDNAFKAGLGLSFFPFKGFIVRVYGDAIKKGVYQSTLAGFVGYELQKKFIGGVEYNYQFNYRFGDGEDRYGYSVYGSYYFLPQWQVFVRFDQVASNKLENQDSPWAREDDGSAIVGGVEFSPIKYVKMALNFQDWLPYAGDLEHRPYLYLNLEFKL